MAEDAPQQPESSAQNQVETEPASLEEPSARAGGIASMMGRLSGTQWLLVINTIAVALLAFGVVWLTNRPVQVLPAVEQAVGMGLPPSVAIAEQGEPPVAPLVLDAPPPKEGSVSFIQAQAAYDGSDYVSALKQYADMAALAEADPAADVMRDFFRLRMALCYQHLSRVADAKALLERTATSKSPAVRALANYRLAIVDEHEGRYLQARMRAYLAASATLTAGGLSELSNDCEFLIARSLTRKALSYFGHDRSIPWSELPLSDPLVGLDETRLRELLHRRAGVESEAMLGPRVEQSGLAGQVPLWTATSMRAAVGDLLNIFVAEADLDLQWVLVSDSVRNRAVSLHLPNVSSQRLCEVAAGCAGLVARFTGEKVIIHNPPAMESMKDQRDVLLDEAISAWRRLFLRASQDSRIAEGYFALGLLHECCGATTEAINDYQLTAKRFAKARVASVALLRSARLLCDLRDYTSARTELLELLDRYPECQETGGAYAALGDATMQAGRTAEAFSVFRKLHYMDLSPQSARDACLGAGKCLYAEGRYEEAVEWLERYIALCDGAGDELSGAYLLLGRSYHAKGSATRAVVAFHQAMAMSARSTDRVTAALAVSRAYMDTGDLARALGTLESLEQVKRADGQDYQIRLLTARLYRVMGLSDRAASYLRGAINEVTESKYKALLTAELGRCYSELERFNEAAEVMTEALGGLGVRSEAYETACDLAEVCLKINRPAQAETLIGEVLASPAGAEIQIRARRLLAEALLAQEQYEQAAVALVDLQAQQTQEASQ